MPRPRHQGLDFADLFAQIRKRYQDIVTGLDLDLDINKYLDQIEQQLLISHNLIMLPAAVNTSMELF